MSDLKIVEAMTSGLPISKRDARQLLEALSAAGFVVVPVEPTDQQCLSGYVAGRDYGNADNRLELARIAVQKTYRAMVEASK